MAGLTIGDLAARTGMSVPAIRHYEAMGILSPLRNAGGHRRFDKSDIRRLSFAMIAQGLGVPLAQIAQAMAVLPADKAPSKADWSRFSNVIRGELDMRINRLTALRDKLEGCIGCGCLSMEKCALWNPKDRAHQLGPGPRWVMGDSAQS